MCGRREKKRKGEKEEGRKGGREEGRKGEREEGRKEGGKGREEGKDAKNFVFKKKYKIQKAIKKQHHKYAVHFSNVLFWSSLFYDIFVYDNQVLENHQTAPDLCFVFPCY